MRAQLSQSIPLPPRIKGAQYRAGGDAALYLLVGVGILAWYAQLTVGLFTQWWSDANYSHGFLIPPLVAYFIWKRREKLAAARLRPSGWGAVLAILGLTFYVLGIVGAELFVARLSLIPVLAGAVWFLAGREHLRVLRFPLLYLVLMIPLPAIVFDRITVPLQILASQIGEIAIRAAGVPVLRDGNVLELVGVRLEVAEACSGIRSLFSLLAFALAFGHFNRYSPARLTLLAAASLPVAIVANAARVAATGIAADFWGAAATEGLVHSGSGTLVFGVAVGSMFLLHRLTSSPAKLEVPR